MSSDHTEEEEGVEVDDVVDVIEDTIGSYDGPNQDTEAKRDDKDCDGFKVPSSKELIVVRRRQKIETYAKSSFSLKYSNLTNTFIDYRTCYNKNQPCQAKDEY